MEETIHAVLTIHKASEMTPARRREIAEWLRKEAKDILRGGDEYAARYRARYRARYITTQ
jgi:hypothetical protein